MITGVINKSILKFCYILNIVMVVFLLSVIIGILFKAGQYLDFVFSNEIVSTIRMIFTIPIIILWINNMIIWSRRDKHIGRFFLLFFLNGIYNVFYFRKVLKNSWI